MEDPNENADWVLSSVQGLQFRKVRRIRIGDEVLIASSNAPSWNKNGNDPSRAVINRPEQLPRSWIRLLENHLLLRTQLLARPNQLSHHLHVCVRSLFEDEPRHFLNLLESNKLGSYRTESLLTPSDIHLIRTHLLQELHMRENEQLPRFQSLADSQNRKRDRSRVQSTLYVPELGYDGCGINFYSNLAKNANNDAANAKNKNLDNADARGALIARGYERVVYGDHGPYLEFRKDQIEWSSFPNRNEKGASVAYYDEFYTLDGVVKLYQQRKNVADQPNPPQNGKYFCNHNRKEGYADYKVGMIYISPDDLCVALKLENLHTNKQSMRNDGDFEDSETPYLYLLSSHSENLRQQRRAATDSRQRSNRWKNIQMHQKNSGNNGNDRNNGNNGNNRGSRGLGKIDENEVKMDNFAQGYDRTGRNDDTMSVMSAATNATNATVSTAVATVATRAMGADTALERYNAIMAGGNGNAGQAGGSQGSQGSQGAAAAHVPVYQPKTLKINMMEVPQIRTKDGKRAMNALVNGDYIPGLIFVPEFISKDEESDIKDYLVRNSDVWQYCKIQQKRRSLQFGWHLDYQSMELYRARPERLEKIPDEMEWIPRRIESWMEENQGKKVKEFNQLILNEYAPNQGIAQHTDRTHVFGPVVAGLSLFTPCVIEFINKRDRKGRDKKQVLLPPRSLFIMTGESRYEWTHGIEAKREHQFHGHTIRRGVRYSMTFRHAIAHSSEVLSRSSYNQVSADAMTVH